MKVLCIEDRMFNVLTGHYRKEKLRNVTKGKFYTVLGKYNFTYREAGMGYGTGLHYYINGNYSNTWIFHTRLRIPNINNKIKIL